MDTIKKDHLELISNLEQQLEEANSRVSTTNVDIKHKEVTYSDICLLYNFTRVYEVHEYIYIIE